MLLQSITAMYPLCICVLQAEVGQTISLKSLCSIFFLFASESGNPTLTINFFRYAIEMFFVSTQTLIYSTVESRNILYHNVGLLTPELRNLADHLSNPPKSKDPLETTNSRFYLTAKYLYNLSLISLIKLYEEKDSLFAIFSSIFGNAGVPSLEFLETEILLFENWRATNYQGESPKLDSAFIQRLKLDFNTQRKFPTNLNFRRSDFPYIKQEQIDELKNAKKEGK